MSTHVTTANLQSTTSTANAKEMTAT